MAIPVDRFMLLTLGCFTLSTSAGIADSGVAYFGGAPVYENVAYSAEEKNGRQVGDQPSAIIINVPVSSSAGSRVNVGGGPLSGVGGGQSGVRSGPIYAISENVRGSNGILVPQALNEPKRAREYANDIGGSYIGGSAGIHGTGGNVIRIIHVGNRPSNYAGTGAYEARELGGGIRTKYPVSVIPQQNVFRTDDGFIHAGGSLNNRVRGNHIKIISIGGDGGATVSTGGVINTQGVHGVNIRGGIREIYPFPIAPFQIANTSGTSGSGAGGINSIRIIVPGSDGGGVYGPTGRHYVEKNGVGNGNPYQVPLHNTVANVGSYGGAYLRGGYYGGNSGSGTGGAYEVPFTPVRNAVATGTGTNYGVRTRDNRIGGNDIKIIAIDGGSGASTVTGQSFNGVHDPSIQGGSREIYPFPVARLQNATTSIPSGNEVGRINSIRIIALGGNNGGAYGVDGGHYIRSNGIGITNPHQIPLTPVTNAITTADSYGGVYGTGRHLGGNRDAYQVPLIPVQNTVATGFGTGYGIRSEGGGNIIRIINLGSGGAVDQGIRGNGGDSTFHLGGPVNGGRVYSVRGSLVDAGLANGNVDGQGISQKVPSGAVPVIRINLANGNAGYVTKSAYGGQTAGSTAEGGNAGYVTRSAYGEQTAGSTAEGGNAGYVTRSAYGAQTAGSTAEGGNAGYVTRSAYGGQTAGRTAEGGNAGYVTRNSYGGHTAGSAAEGGRVQVSTGSADVIRINLKDIIGGGGNRIKVGFEGGGIYGNAYLSGGEKKIGYKK